MMVISRQGKEHRRPRTDVMTQHAVSIRGAIQKIAEEYIDRRMD